MGRHGHTRKVGVGVVIAVLLAPLLLASTHDVRRSVDRLYLTRSDAGFLHWSPVSDDPELSTPSVEAVCPYVTTDDTQRCASAGTGNQVVFTPAGILDQKVTWSSAAPLRVHLELDVTSAQTPTVVVGMQDGFTLSWSNPLTQVQPGVWEGTITAGSRSWDPGRGNAIYLQFRDVDALSFELGLAGRSYVELAQPVPGRSVPDLLDASPTEALTTYETPARTLWFADDAWTVHRFEGDLSAPRTFAFDLPKDAATIYAWVEAADGPFVHGVTNGDVEPARMTDTPIMFLRRNGVDIATSKYQYNQRGRSSNTLAVNGVTAAPLQLEVRQYDGSPSLGQDYVAYVAVIHGDRTLKRIRYDFEIAATEPFTPVRANGVVGTCINGSEAIPTTSAVSTFEVDLDWDSPTAPLQRWTLNHTYPNGVAFNCSQAGAGDALRVTVPRTHIWDMSPTPAVNGHFASYRDTLFTFDITFDHFPLEP